MATHPEDLGPGDWVVVTRYKHWQGGEDEDGVPTRPTFDGFPLLVRAIGLPFLAVSTVSGIADSIDIRDYEVQRVPSEYADPFVEDHKSVKEDRSGLPEKPPEAERMLCPLCLERLWRKQQADGEWLLACDCGLRATSPAEKTT